MSWNTEPSSRVAARAAARSFESARWDSSGWAWTTGSGSVRWPGPSAGERAEGQELHPDLAGRRAVAPRHVRPQARRRRPTSGASSSRSPRRSRACRSARCFPNLAKVMDRVTLIRSMTSPESDHDRAAHHLLTGYRPSPALVYPGLWQRGRQGARGDARDAAAVRRGARRPDLRLERLPDAGLRPVRRLGRSQPGRASGSRT